MRELHLFAGAGGGILGGYILGNTCVCAVELDKFCRERIHQRQREGHIPRFPVWDDVRTFDGRPWRGLVDVVCGGFPCQDISAAGKGIGITGERSGLWVEMARIIGEVRPRFALVENSPVLTSRGLGIVLGDLATLGYDARWGVIAASKDGQRRGQLTDPAMGAIPAGGALNPDWVELLMGWPSGWTSAAELSPEEFQWWLVAFSDPLNNAWRTGEWERDVPRVAKVKDRTNRLKAIGNGQVPLVVAVAFQLLGKDS